MLGADCCPILGRQEADGMKTLTRIAFLGSLFLVPMVLCAQDSCVDSPECPTAILGVVGAAAAALYVRWRSR
jgi:hypothetical protein